MIDRLHKIPYSPFIAYFSQTSLAKDYFFRKAKQTVNLASINMTILSNFPVPVPSRSEQFVILEEIESRLSVCDQLETDIITNLQKAEALRQSILKRAFEGKLVSQDPDDEPASVLLERIRAEKAAEKAAKKLAKSSKHSVSRKRKKVSMADLLEVLEAENDWISAQDAFSRCGIANNSSTDTIEKLYFELRDILNQGRIEVERRDNDDFLRILPMEKK